MSLDRRDLTIGSDKSSSLSRSEAGTYDVIQAEIQHSKRQELNTAIASATNNGHSGAGGAANTETDAEAKKRVSRRRRYENCTKQSVVVLNNLY